WISLVNDTTGDTDDDWAWGATNTNPRKAWSQDRGQTWEEAGRSDNFAFAMFDIAGVTALALGNAVLDELGQPIDTANVGDRIIYRLEASNNSEVTANGVAIVASLPEEVLFVSAATDPPIAH